MPDHETASVGADVDVSALMDEIRAEVERKRQAGAYPPDVLTELDLLDGTAGRDRSGAFDRVLSDLHRTAGFSTEITTASEKPLVAPVVATTKRLIRKGLRWYLTGILHQVREFSGNVIRGLRILADRQDTLEGRIDEVAASADERLDRLPALLDELRARLDALEQDRAADRIGRLDRGLRDLRDRLESGAVAAREAGAKPVHAERTRKIESSLDYLEFENRFRGTEEEIRHRQQVYVDRFRGVRGPVVDLGCGRGEFLVQLREAGIDAYGVDRHPDMVLRVREQDLRIEQDEALAHLASVEPGSLGGIFSAQMIEHLEASEVPRFFELAFDALAPDGVLVVETINPGSLFVFAHAFYVDLAHLRPLHWLTLRFLAEVTGFREVDVDFQSPPPPEFRPQPVGRADQPAVDAALERIDENFRRIDDILFGPQDYAVVARR